MAEEQQKREPRERVYDADNGNEPSGAEPHRVREYAESGEPTFSTERQGPVEPAERGGLKVESGGEPAPAKKSAAKKRPAKKSAAKKGG
jgi:hypothetical protein